ncbi:alpha-amylase family glycosyl hydrolase [Streptomyces fumanus]|uniref:Glycosyl hydrolase family 13 catalytic domain-containing protein n=1 Tax=Streptomyces fumanus TaxID=67302 RepID=A0A919E0Q2_9ACTN|nr:hypothetical protein GCM10018772_22860 [Streptomyces fumanus]
MTGLLSRRRTARWPAVALILSVLPALPPTTPTADAVTPRPPSDHALARTPARPAPSREQFYLVLPDRFANGTTSNDEGGMTGGRSKTGYDPTDKNFYQGGDLRGLIEKLDYIKDLGTTAIWMAPVFKNRPVQTMSGTEMASYHGYSITDFTRVDPHFGTNAELAELVDKAHAKGMKVFFDVITNHTADTVDYAEKTYGYRSKGAFPYLDAEGRPFDDGSGMREIDEDGFPYTPRPGTGEHDTKVPAWLNDPTMYHNRGDSTFAGESALYGDFKGNDDLWTERPEVVEGMRRIYERWVKDFGIDGFRVDTAKNVNMAFWTQWATALDAYAARQGKRDFFIFAEAFSADPVVMAPYLTEGRLDATLDFPLQAALRNYASRGGPTRDLAHVLAQDYRYTTDKADAYGEVTFLGSHDMGRIGGFISQDNPGADDAELRRRDRFAHELMFLSRGNPVIYAGDEQGFTGSADDVYARQTMFASQVPEYLDDDQIGTERTHASDAYDPTHPLYRSIAELSELTRRHPALRDGVQQERYADDGPGVYAFSRTDAGQRVEYVVAVNNASTARTVEVPTYSARMDFRGVYGSSARVRSGADRKVRVEVPPLSAVVLKAAGPVARAAGGPSVSVSAPAAGASGDVEVSAEVGGGGLNRVVFAAQVGNGPWRTLGSADHAPYKVTQHLPQTVGAGTALRYKAVVVDSAGRTASDTAATTAGQPPAPEKPTAKRHHAVVHHRRTDGDYDGLLLRTADGTTARFTGRDAYGAFAWITPGSGTDAIRFTIEKDGVPDGPERVLDVAVSGEVWTEQNSTTVLKARPKSAYPPQDGTKAVLHYHRPDGDYEGWGLHTWTGSADPPEWNDPIRPVREDPFGLVFEVPLNHGAASLSYILHKGQEKDIPDDEALDFSLYGHEVWRVAGDPTYLTPSPGGAFGLDLRAAEATWIGDDTVVWAGEGSGVASQQLVYATEGNLTIENGALTDEGQWLRLVPTELTEAQRSRYPQYAQASAFRVDPRDRDRVGQALRARLIATQRADDGALLGATGVRIEDTRPEGTGK